MSMNVVAFSLTRLLVVYKTMTHILVPQERVLIVVGGAVGLATFAYVDPPRFRTYIIRPVQRTVGKVFTVAGFVTNFAADFSTGGKGSSKETEWKQILTDLN
jgi:hypothetical protein